MKTNKSSLPNTLLLKVLEAFVNMQEVLDNYRLVMPFLILFCLCLEIFRLFL